MVDRLSYFSLQPVLHDWCNQCCCMYYLLCGMMHIKDPLLLIGKNIPCSGDRGFLPLVTNWSFVLCPTSYNLVLSLYCYGRKEGNVLFNDALNTFYLRLYGVRHMVKDLSDSERGNPLPPHGLLFPISSKGYFICTIPQTG